MTTTAAMPPAMTRTLLEEESFLAWVGELFPLAASVDVEFDESSWPRGFSLGPAGMFIVSAE